MPRAYTRKLHKYSEEFKATAVVLSELDGVAVQDVANELDIHPFMLSRWRKQVRDGVIAARKKQILDPEIEAQLKELKQLKKDHARLKMEHDLLKKAIAFTSKRRTTSSNSSTNSGK